MYRKKRVESSDFGSGFVSDIYRVQIKRVLKSNRSHLIEYEQALNYYNSLRFRTGPRWVRV